MRERRNDVRNLHLFCYYQTYPGQAGVRIEIQNIVRDGDQVTVVSKNNIDTYFANIFKRSDLDIGVTSTALYADRAMDVALVLDTTYSMNANNKIGTLKTAASGLLNTFDALDNDNLRVAVVPFSEYVNVGKSRRYEPWLDVPADETVCRNKRDVTSRSNCQCKMRNRTADAEQEYDCCKGDCVWTESASRNLYPGRRALGMAHFGRNGAAVFNASEFEPRAGKSDDRYDGRREPTLEKRSLSQR